MSLETINFQLFDVLNAPASASPADINIAIFMANDTLYILMLFLVLAWFLGSYHSKALALKAVLTAAVALLIGYVISLGYHHPRPFMLEMGNTLIKHAPTYSFPSNHMLIFSSIAFSYIFAQRMKLGLILFGIAIIVAWARVYVGVHFPLDMFGAILVAVLTSVLMQYIWNQYKTPIMAFALKIYQFIFAVLLQKGIIR
ncbi:undecaprenyl-diphosphatase [Acinetobacter calcoaceticus]|uniref:undecaprenyl-diphosphate phosphatase n=1 Tax=Acinetobacter calcoaceticus TaxID=471 RepID=A0A4R1XM69_ACICA|nr:undecaprenyl-diphosphatase [Acinetobacter calcoaceticus]